MKVFTASEIHAVLDWECVISAINHAHQGARHKGDGFFLGNSQFGLLTRGVILPGRGAGLKLASICPENSRTSPPRPVEDAAFIVIDEQTKAINAIMDGPAITQWKTAGDSVTAARILSREESEVLLVLGAGPVAAALVEAYLHIRPGLCRILLWNRTSAKLEPTFNNLRARGLNVEIVSELNEAISEADIITSATSSSTPLIVGSYVKPGTHVDLLGGYRPDMQEADCDIMCRGRIFVDDRTNALLSGDIAIPINQGKICASKIEGDLYDICQSGTFIRHKEDITVYKNAGGAHIDLAVSLMVINLLSES